MRRRHDRRRFLRTAAAAGAALGLGDWPALLPFAPLRAEDRAIDPAIVRHGENRGWTSSAWKPHLAATASFSFLGADAPDTATTPQIREALRGG